eukprot:SAG11_NODE_2094_length_3834_cov_1.595181_4_plen_270_part_00
MLNTGLPTYHSHYFDGGNGRLPPRNDWPPFHHPQEECPCDILDTFHGLYSSLDPHLLAIWAAIAAFGELAMASAGVEQARSTIGDAVANVGNLATNSHEVKVNATNSIGKIIANTSISSATSAVANGCPLNAVQVTEGSWNISMSSNERTFPVKVPGGAVPGASMQVEFDGRERRVVLPEGAEPGSTIQVPVQYLMGSGGAVQCACRDGFIDQGHGFALICVNQTILAHDLGWDMAMVGCPRNSVRSAEGGCNCIAGFAAIGAQTATAS